MNKLRFLILPLLFWVAFASLPVAQTGCQAPSTRVKQVQTLKAVGQSAELAVATSAQLYGSHLITDKQARDIIDLYNLHFQPAYRLAVNAVNANLDSVAAPELVALAAQLSALVLSYQKPSAFNYLRDDNAYPPFAILNSVQSIPATLVFASAPMICPECQKAGLKSTSTYLGSTTTLAFMPMRYDEFGHLITNSGNNVTTGQYRCSNGHEYTISTPSY